MFDLNFPFDLLSECDYLNLDIIGNRVRNKVIFSNDDFIIMAVIGPNKRSDYHVNSKQVKYCVCSHCFIFLGIFLSDKRPT